VNKKLACLVLVGVMALSSAALAKKSKGSSGRKNVNAVSGDVFINPLGLLFGVLNAGYEGKLANNQSWTAQGLFSGRGIGDWSYTMMGVGGSWRFYFDEDKPMQTLFVGPMAEIVNFSFGYKILDKHYNSSSTMLGVGAEGGYQWIFDNGFVITPMLQLVYLAGTVNLESGAPAVPFGGVGLGLGLSVGYAF
jgi:hypothetical protein